MSATTNQWATNVADPVTAVCAAIRHATEGYGGVMRLAHSSGIPAATIKAYRAGTREPSATAYLRLKAANDQLAQELNALEEALRQCRELPG